MATTTGGVLIVDDEFLIQELWSISIECMGLNVCGRAATAEHAIKLATELRPDLVLMDMRLQGDGDGVDAAIAINAAVGAKIIFVTGSRETTTLERIKTDHPAAVLFKPVADSQLRTVVRSILAN